MKWHLITHCEKASKYITHNFLFFLQVCYLSFYLHEPPHGMIYITVSLQLLLLLLAQIGKKLQLLTPCKGPVQYLKEDIYLIWVITHNKHKYKRTQPIHVLFIKHQLLLHKLVTMFTIVFTQPGRCNNWLDTLWKIISPATLQIHNKHL